MNLPQQEGGKRFAGLTIEIVTGSIVTRSLQTVESELTSPDCAVAQPENGN